MGWVRTGPGRAGVATAVLSLALLAGVAGVAANPGGGQPGAPDCPPERLVSCAGADLTLADLGVADFRGADLRGATLNGAFLHSASLAGADLRGADVRATTLTGADLRGSALAGANLADANLEFARVSAHGLDDAYLCRTRLPGGQLSERDCAEPGPALHEPATLRSSRALAMDAPAPRLGTPKARGEDGTKSRAKAATRHRGGKRREKRAAVKVIVSGPGEVVASQGALHCPTRCSVRYRKGTRLSFTATPQPGAEFAGWSGACDGTGDCTFRVGQPHRNKLTATFDVPGCTLPPTQDTDGDGLPDCMEIEGWEIAVTTAHSLTSGTGPATREVTSDASSADSDGDGTGDGDEFAFGADPGQVDTDGDGLDDSAEIRTHKSLPNHADTDNDSLPPGGGPRDPRLFDGNEVEELGTSPRLADTDGDGLSDYVEVIQESTNPLVADLPLVELVAVPGRSNPQLDLDYTVEETTGTEQERSSTTGVAASSESSNETSRETTEETSREMEIGGSCTWGSPAESGCTVETKFKFGAKDSVTRGSKSEFSNTREMSEEHEQLASRSAERRVEVAPSGCMQVVLRLENNGPVSVSVGNLEALAWTPNQEAPNSSNLLAALQPIQGDIAAQTCPATDPGFGPVELPPGSSADVAFGQRMNSRSIIEYLSNPAPISYELGAITMRGSDLVGNEVDFLGETATKVRDRTAHIEINFGDGTLAGYDVAVARTFDDQGGLDGLTLAEALGPEFADLAPEYTDGTPARIEALRNPETGEVKANGADRPDGDWSIAGDAVSLGGGTTSWQDFVLHPGDVISLSYSRDSDRDALPDGYEGQIGTSPSSTDTDGDHAACSSLPAQPPSPSDPPPAEWPQGCKEAWTALQQIPDSPYFTSSDYFEAKIGWTIPFARDDQSEYHAFSSAISCDIDADGSPDGPGAGNGEFGECPASDFPPEMERLTDPNRTDTNGDGIGDGEQALPDALRGVPLGGRLPVKVREWGGPAELGNADAFGIAVDNNQPVLDDQGKALPISSYVIQRFPSSDQTDAVVRFIGNPRLGVPYRDEPLFPNGGDFPGNNNTPMAATGIAVAPGSVGSEDSAGSPVVVNYQAKDLGLVSNAAEGTAAFTTFNGTTGHDLGGTVGDGVFGAYGGFCCFQAPVFPPGEPSIGNGFLDAASPKSVVISHGRHKIDPEHNRIDNDARPSRYVGKEVPADDTFKYGHKPTDPLAPEPGNLTDPSGIAIDREAGTLYVADDFTADIDIDDTPTTLLGSLTRFNLASGEVEEFVTNSTGLLANIRGLAVDPEGPYLYAASAHCRVIYKLSESLSILGTIGGPACPAGPSGFERPEDVDVDSANGLWVADSGSSLLSFYFYPFGPS